MSSPRFAPLVGSLLIALTLGAHPSHGQAEEAGNYALLVGVARYSHAQMNEPQLEYPESDANAVGEFLAAHGYQVEYLLGKDATKQAIETKLAGLAAKGNSESAVVLGLWGHGVEYAGSDEAMYCPYDARIRLAVDSEGNALFDDDGNKLIEPDPASLVGMSKLLDALRVCGAGSKLLLADCCRNSPNRPKGRAFGSAVKLTDLPADTAALFACSQFEQAFEHRDWGHGAFTKCLLENLNGMQPEGAGVLGIVAPLRRDVAALVNAKSAGRDKQTVALVNNGIPDLRLVAPKESFAGKSDPVMRTLSSSSSTPSGPTPRSFEGTKAGEVRTLVADPAIEFCWCPAGSFKMGSPESDRNAFGNEKPQVDVELTEGFWMAKTELTQDQWQTVTQTKPWTEQDPDLHMDYDGSKYPAAYVSWDDAVDYCAKLTDREHHAGRLPTAWEYALPTEAQWEYACRAGTTTQYSFGDDASQLGRYAWFSTNTSYESRWEVGAKLANRWGLLDAHGNVWEWCRDSYNDDTPQLPGGSDPLVVEGSFRVLRGGGWRNTAWNARSAIRRGNSPTSRNDNLGFRVACVPSE